MNGENKITNSLAKSKAIKNTPTLKSNTLITSTKVNPIKAKPSSSILTGSKQNLRLSAKILKNNLVKPSSKSKPQSKFELFEKLKSSKTKEKPAANTQLIAKEKQSFAYNPQVKSSFHNYSSLKQKKKTLDESHLCEKTVVEEETLKDVIQTTFRSGSTLVFI